MWMAVATRRARMYVISCSWRKEATGDIKDPENLDLTRINVMPFHPSSAHKLPLFPQSILTFLIINHKPQTIEQFPFKTTPNSTIKFPR